MDILQNIDMSKVITFVLENWEIIIPVMLLWQQALKGTLTAIDKNKDVEDKLEFAVRVLGDALKYLSGVRIKK